MINFVYSNYGESFAAEVLIKVLHFLGYFQLSKSKDLKA